MTVLLVLTPGRLTEACKDTWLKLQALHPKGWAEGMGRAQPGTALLETPSSSSRCNPEGCGAMLP